MRQVHLIPACIALIQVNAAQALAAAQDSTAGDGGESITVVEDRGARDVICVKAPDIRSAHDFPASKPVGGLAMQDLNFVTEDQASWLRLLESRQYEKRSDRIAIPDEVLDALVEKGLVRRWHDGDVAITLGGIKEVAQH